MDVNKSDVCQTRLVCHQLLSIHLVGRVRNKRVLKAVGQILLLTYVNRRQLVWLGHALREPDGSTKRL